MKFYTCSDEARPVRLSEATRRFADESLRAKYGDEAMEHYAVAMDDVPGFAEMSALDKYDAMIAKIAAEAPVRIVPGELVSGAATLGKAIEHAIPATYKGEHIMVSVSHVTLGFGRVLTLGMDGIEAETRACADSPLKSSILRSIDALRVWHGRYLAAAKTAAPDNYRALLRVPFKKPESFREAVQSLWFMFAFERLCGNWPGIGRIDEMLGGYLSDDLASGRLTLGEAREILAHFFIKGCEWIRDLKSPGSGDAQHYQNIVLGGVNADGFDVTNEVTYLALDVVEELAISDFPITIRFSRRSPEKLWRRAADVIKHGGGVVAAYNENLIIDSLVSRGWEKREARCFANDGCWEVQVPGKTFFTYIPFDGLRILQNDTLGLNGEPKDYASYDELYAAFIDNLQTAVGNIYAGVTGGSGRFTDSGFVWKEGSPCSLIAMLTDGCARSGRGYYGGGPKYNVVSPHIGGAPDVGNSLRAIKTLVYDEKRVTLRELEKILADDWAGRAELRAYALNKLEYYGNDDDEADSFTARVLDDFADIVTSTAPANSPIRFIPGVSTFGRQIEWAPERLATSFGKLAHSILSGNASPTPGTDEKGATAIIKSYCKADLHRQTCGAALDIKLHPSAVRGRAEEVLSTLLKGFVDLGGFFMQIDIIDAAALREAQKHPEDFRTLSVRVSGWNARFVTLNKEWQQMIIERTEQGI